MIVHLIEQKEADELLEKLELIKHRKHGSHWLSKQLSEGEIATLYSEVHRFFHYEVSKFFSEH